MPQGPKYPTCIGRCTAMPSLRDRVKGQRELPSASTAGADAFIEAANEVQRDATATAVAGLREEGSPTNDVQLATE